MAASVPKGKMVSTRILIISDTHAQLPLPAEGSPVPFHYPLPSADVLIHCGDLTMNGKLAQHEAAMELIASANADLKIVIPGNHDLSLDKDYYRRFPHVHTNYGPYSDETLDRIRELYTGPKAREAGIRYLEEGVAEFRLRNGARLNIYASAYQPAFCNWAFGYPRTVDRYNPRQGGGGGPECAVPDHGGVDIMITHGPPRGILDKVWRGEEADGHHVGCEHLRRAVERCRPRIHCFGHIHEAWGAVRKRWDAGDLGPEQVYTAGAAPSTSDGHGCGKRNDEDRQDGSATMSVEGSSRSRPLPTEKSHRKGAEPDVSSSTPTSKLDPTPPYHPRNNPSSYYMYPHQLQRNVHADETLLLPAPYDEQVRRMCTSVDARGLEFGSETLFVNASIMNLRYEPLNAPWVVDVMLPEAGPSTGLGETATLSERVRE